MTLSMKNSALYFIRKNVFQLLCKIQEGSKRRQDIVDSALLETYHVRVAQ